MELLRGWLNTCEHKHQACQQRRGKHQAFVPDRLIDVKNDAALNIRIVNGTDVPRNAKYVTLSHCWGPPGPNKRFVLLESNMSDFMKSIPLQELPKTFADACSVSRCLGVQYLWIDSLCIIQDSKADWRRNAAIMWEIYSNSYLNLSATASRDSSQGLFRKRNPATLSPCAVTVPDGHPQIASGDYICYEDDEWRRLIDNGPVNTRAWVVQERLLSVRIVHFSEEQIFWECHELKAAERFTKGIPSRYESSSERDLLHSGLQEDEPRKLLEVWDRIVAEYTSSGLTYGSDKLVAVSALARQVSQHSKNTGEYLAGLWGNNLTGQLCWSSSSRTVRSQEYRAPSWSWACLNGTIWPRFDWSGYGYDGYRHDSKPLVKINEAHVTSESDAFASVIAGELHLSALLCRITLAEPETPPSRPDPKTSEERRAGMIDMISQVDSSVTGDNMNSTGVSDGPLPTGSQLIDIDPMHGIICVDDSAPHQLDKIEDEANPHRDFKMDLGQHKGDIHLDEDIHREELSQMDLMFMPVLCHSELDRVYNKEGFEIESIRGLILTQAEVNKNGVYRRIGVCTLDEYAAAEFFCNLGNQEFDMSLRLDDTLESTERLKLEDFVPENWPGKELSFVPTDFARYKLTIV
jgi:Heterokaryon incompatibility protein (HET)